MQKHEVKNRRHAPSTVTSYYHPEAKGSAVVAAMGMEVVGSDEEVGGVRAGGVSVDGVAHVPGAGAPEPRPPARPANRFLWLAALTSASW